MKKKEKQNPLKNEAEASNDNPAELAEDELVQISGGHAIDKGDGICPRGYTVMVADCLKGGELSGGCPFAIRVVDGEYLCQKGKNSYFGIGLMPMK